MAQAGLVLINLENQGAFIFQYFPQSLRTQERANWQAQETTIGVKPLFYANREPRRTEFSELYFDNTETGESLTETLKELRTLMVETERGTPPALQAAWGDRHERCVLEELSIEEMFFNAGGEPTRAKIGLSLIQIQSDSGEAVSVTVND